MKKNKKWITTILRCTNCKEDTIHEFIKYNSNLSTPYPGRNLWKCTLCGYIKPGNVFPKNFRIAENK